MTNASSSSSLHELPLESRLRFDARVMDGIASEVLTAFNAVPRRGAETGGILLGRRSDEGVQVQDFEPVLCEHRFGPSYALSEDDLQGLQESLDWFRTSGQSGVGVLGFYRSETRPDAGVEPQDLDLMQRFFADAGMLFLLLKPTKSQTISAEIFRLADSNLEALTEPAVFPLNADFGIPVFSSFRELREEAPQLEPEPPAQPELEPQPEPESAVPVLVEPVVAEPPSQPQPVTAPRSGVETRPSEPHWDLPPATRPRRLEPEEPHERRWLWPAAVVLLMIAGAVLGFRSVGPLLPAPAPAVPATQPVAKTAEPPPVQTAPVSLPVTAPVTPPVEADIRSAISRWERAMRSGNINLILECYAPQLERYYTLKNASSADVRQTVSKSLARYGRPAVLRLSEMTVVPQSETRAIVTFRKHWQTSGPRIFAGEEQERMGLLKTQDTWKIYSEQETRVYWSQRPK